MQSVDNFPQPDQPAPTRNTHSKASPEICGSRCQGGSPQCARTLRNGKYGNTHSKAAGAMYGYPDGSEQWLGTLKPNTAKGYRRDLNSFAERIGCSDLGDMAAQLLTRQPESRFIAAQLLNTLTGPASLTGQSRPRACPRSPTGYGGPRCGCSS